MQRRLRACHVSQGTGATLAGRKECGVLFMSFDFFRLPLHTKGGAVELRKENGTCRVGEHNGTFSAVCAARMAYTVFLIPHGKQKKKKVRRVNFG